MIENLKIEHERCDWQRWCHSQGHRNDDGRLTIPAEHVARWERQIETAYADLSEREKQSDRDQADRYWSLIDEYLCHDDEPRQ